MGTPQEHRSYNLDFEQNRLAEAGMLAESRRISLIENLRAEIAERVEMFNPFEYQLNAGEVHAKGYEHRGDMSNTFKKSEDVADKAGKDPVARRFALETAGYEAAKFKFATMPLYSTVALFSPAPTAKIEGYPGYNLMYFYHILPGGVNITSDGKREETRNIKALAYINRFNPQEQADILNDLQPIASVEAEESSILSSPVGVISPSEKVPDRSSFRRIWQRVSEEYEKKQGRDFKLPSYELIENYLLFGGLAWKQRHAKIDAMMESVCYRIEQGAREDDEDLQREWRILLNLADEELLHSDFSDRLPVVDDVPSEALEARVLFEAYMHLNKNVRQTVTSCGNSGELGLNVVFSNPLTKFLSQQAEVSTATIEVKIITNPVNELLGKKEFDGFECPKCNYQTKNRVGNKCPRLSCGLTKEEFARSGGKVC